MGVGVGTHRTNGNNNIILGCGSGINGGPETCNNIFIGQCVNGRDNNRSCTSAHHSIGIGYQALWSNGKGYHVAIGYQANCGSTSGGCNIAIGRNAGENRGGGGGNNVAIGNFAGTCTYASSGNNTYIGNYAGHSSYAASCRNTLVGAYAGCQTKGHGNAFFGLCVGKSNTTGCCNVAIGYNVELPSATGNNQFAIGIDANRWLTGDSSYNVTIAGIATITATGIVSATKFCGDGSCLTGISGGVDKGGSLKIFKNRNYVSDAS